MAEGFVHEYEVSSEEEPSGAITSGKLKFPRSARQAAGTAKGLEALARRRAEATEKKVLAKTLASGLGSSKTAAEMPRPEAATTGEADEEMPAGAGAGAGAAAGAGAGAQAARPRGRPPKVAGAAAPPPAQTNPYAHDVSVKASFDPLAMARLAQMEIELEKLRRKQVGWGKTKGKSKKHAASESESSESEGSDEEEEDDEPPKRKRARASRSKTPGAPGKRAAPVAQAVASSEPKIDFFDALMSSNFGRR